MTLRRLSVSALLGTLLVSAAFVACTGEAPAPVASTDPPDASSPNGTDAAPTTSDSGTCAAPLQACGGGCIDTQSSDQHCGRCDRACGVGSSCSAGHCAPVVLATSLDSPSALAVGTGVIVMTVNNGLVRCGKDGCSGGVNRLWTDPGIVTVPGALSLSSDSTYAFTLGSSSNPGFPDGVNILKVWVDGNAPLVPSVETSALTPSFTLGNSFDLATDAREHAIASPYRTHRCFVNGCSNVVVLGEGETPSSILLTPTHYAWTLTGNSTVRTCPRPPASATDYGGALDCGTPTELIARESRTTGFIAHHDGVIYWADWSQNSGTTGRVLACAANGCNGTPLVVATAEHVIDGLAVDASGVYWTNAVTGTVRVCRDLVDGCGTNAETLASGTTNPGPIALDDAFVYFIARGATPSNGTLLKVAK